MPSSDRIGSTLLNAVLAGIFYICVVSYKIGSLARYDYRDSEFIGLPFSSSILAYLKILYGTNIIISIVAVVGILGLILFILTKIAAQKKTREFLTSLSRYTLILALFMFVVCVFPTGFYIAGKSKEITKSKTYLYKSEKYDFVAKESKRFLLKKEGAEEFIYAPETNVRVIVLPPGDEEKSKPSLPPSKTQPRDTL